MTAGRKISSRQVLLLNDMGWRKGERYLQYMGTNSRRDKQDIYLDKFGAHVEPISNPIVTRFTFHKQDQGNENVEKYVTELKLIRKDCEFGSSSDNMIQDRLFLESETAEPKKNY